MVCGHAKLAFTMLRCCGWWSGHCYVVHRVFWVVIYWPKSKEPTIMVSKVHVSPWSHEIWDINHVALATYKVRNESEQLMLSLLMKKNNVTKNKEVKNQFHISVKSTWWEMSYCLHLLEYIWLWWDRDPSNFSA